MKILQGVILLSVVLNAPLSALETELDLLLLFDEANRAAVEANDPEAHLEVAAQFRFLLDSGMACGPVFFNLGNAYFRAGEMGLAIASYRQAERYLPRPLLERPKQGFSMALPYMLRDEYRLLFEVFLRPARLAREGWLRQAEIERLLSAHAAGEADHGNRLWLLLNAEVWFRLSVEGVSVADLSEEASGSSVAGAGGSTRVRAV